MRRFVACGLLAAALAGGALADLVVQVKDASGRTVAQLPVSIPPGGSIVITETGQPVPGPAPQPTPQPQPTPNPQPAPQPQPQPAPNVGAAKFMVLVIDQSKPLTAAQQAALADPNLRRAVNQLGLGYAAYALDSVEIQRKRSEDAHGLGYLPFVQQAGGAPCLLLVDAKANLVKGMPLPADAAGIIAAAGGR